MMNLRQDSRVPTFWENLRCYVTEYFWRTSIHGLQFLGEKKRFLLERILWLSILTVSLYFCVISIIEAFHKREQSPVVVSFATSETPVWRIPFPAITICPQVKAYKEIVNYTNLVLRKMNNQSLNEEQMTQLKYMSLICSTRWNKFDEFSEDELSEDVIDFFMKVIPKFNDTVESCYWRSRDCSKNVSNLFTPVITDDGICFTFNLLDRNDMFYEDISFKFYDKHAIPHQRSSNWYLEDGYEDLSDMDNMPRRTHLAGLYGGLELILWTDSINLDYVCGESIQGYKVMLQNSAILPYFNQKYLQVGLNQDVSISVKPIIISTSEKLKYYSLKQRKCFFPGEKKLKLFRVYDQENCYHECFSNFLFNNCKCVPFYLIHNKYTPICGFGKQKCIDEFKEIFVSAAIAFDKRKTSDGIDIMNDCNCLPSCSTLNYETEISQTEWKWQEQAKLLAIYKHDMAGLNEYTRIRIFFGDMQFFTSERNELYGQMDFLASCGGLLGLFVGFSIISLVEFIYFITLRFVCNIYKYGLNYWSGDSELLKNK